MVLTRARAAQAMESDDYTLAVRHVEEGLDQIRAFQRERSLPETSESSGEIQSLENWLEEIRTRRPLSARERLERALRDAINCEDYERAAQVRDALRNLKPAE